MKPITIEKELVGTGGEPIAIATIRQQDIAVAAEVLRKPLYSQPEYSMMREVVTNAADANIRNGKRLTDIDVHVPTAERPTFKVRDRGRGLTTEEMKDVYINYFASGTREYKEVTGDYMAMGAFGLGSKSPFIATGAFTVISVVQEGDRKTKTNYTIKKNEDGLNALYIDSQKSTEEETGLTVIVPVEPRTVNKYQQEARFLFNVFRPERINIDFDYAVNDVLQNPQEVKADGLGQITFFQVPEESYKDYIGYVLVNGIPYKNTINFRYDETARVGNSHVELKELFNSSFIGNFPAAAFTVPPNREAITDNEANREVLKTALTKFAEIWYKRVQGEVDKAASFVEAFHLGVKYAAELRRIGLDRDALTWKGVPLYFTISKHPVVKSKLDFDVYQIYRGRDYYANQKYGKRNQDYLRTITPNNTVIVTYKERPRAFTHKLFNALLQQFTQYEGRTPTSLYDLRYTQVIFIREDLLGRLKQSMLESEKETKASWLEVLTVVDIDNVANNKAELYKKATQSNGTASRASHIYLEQSDLFWDYRTTVSSVRKDAGRLYEPLSAEEKAQSYAISSRHFKSNFSRTLLDQIRNKMTLLGTERVYLVTNKQLKDYIDFFAVEIPEMGLTGEQEQALLLLSKFFNCRIDDFLDKVESLNKAYSQFRLLKQLFTALNVDRLKQMDYNKVAVYMKAATVDLYKSNLPSYKDLVAAYPLSKILFSGYGFGFRTDAAVVEYFKLISDKESL